MQITLKTTLKNQIEMTVAETNGNPGLGFGHAPKCRWVKGHGCGRVKSSTLH